MRSIAELVIFPFLVCLLSSKWQLIPIIRSLNILHLSVSHQGKCNIIKHGMEQCFIHTEKRQSKAHFRVSSGPPSPGGHYRKLMQGNWPAHTFLVLQLKDPFPSPQGTNIAVRLLGKHFSRTTERTLSLKQGMIYPHKILSPAQAIQALHVCVRSRARAKAFPYTAKREMKAAHVRLPFPMVIKFMFDL